MYVNLQTIIIVKTLTNDVYVCEESGPKQTNILYIHLCKQTFLNFN